MKFDWDEAKNKTNIRERGLDFVDACEMFSAPMLVLPDTRKDYGEVRYIGFGYTQGRLMVVIYTERRASYARTQINGNHAHGQGCAGMV